MAIIENQVVSMFYKLTDSSGNVLDSNLKEAPLTFITGKNQIIPGLEKELLQLSKGDKKKVFIKAIDAYGDHDANAMQILPIEQFAGLELKIGMTLYGQGEDGNTAQVVVKEFDNENVTIDFNHPLSGQDLTFDIEIAEVRDATQDELLNGCVAGSHSCCGGHDHEDNHECCGGHGHEDSNEECCNGAGHGHKHEHKKDDHECCGGHGKGSCGSH